MSAWDHEYCELKLGELSKLRFLKNLMKTINYEYSGLDNIQGLSGLSHTFEAIGIRNKNILLVVGGADNENLKKNNQWNPRARLEEWREKALLSAYDVQYALQEEGFIVDLMFFHNINNTFEWSSKVPKPDEWISQKGLPDDIFLSHQYSAKNIPIMAIEELSTIAQSIGACFLSLENLSIDSIAKLSSPHFQKKEFERILRELRFDQYFNPPSDELFLSSYAFSKYCHKNFIYSINHLANQLGHPTVENVIVPEANFRDPLETAKALEKHKYIEFEHHAELTEEGGKVIQSIRKTAQGSIVIRILKAIGLGEMAHAIVKSLKEQ